VPSIDLANGMNTMNTLICAASMLLAATVSASAQGGGGAVPSDVLKDLAPTGKLRAAINLGNSVLAQSDGATGQPKGITPDLAHELGRRLGVPVELVPYQAAGKVFGDVKSDAWDVAFVAIEPVRAAEIEFTAPYVIIEGGYMVPKESPLQTIADVDRPGVRIAVGVGAAYDLYLTRTIKNATIVRAPTGGGSSMIDMFVHDRLEVAAGVKQDVAARWVAGVVLEADTKFKIAKRYPDRLAAPARMDGLVAEWQECLEPGAGLRRFLDLQPGDERQIGDRYP